MINGVSHAFLCCALTSVSLLSAETVLRILACCSCPLGEERFFPTVHDTVVSIRARAADPDAQSTSSGMS